MILDLDRSRPRDPAGSSALAVGAGLTPPTALLSTIDRRLMPSPSLCHRLCLPLSRTDTVRRSRSATEVALLADSLQMGNLRRLRFDEGAPGFGTHRNLDGNHHPQRSWNASRSTRPQLQDHFRGLTRRGCPSRDMVLEVDITCADPIAVAELRQGEKVNPARAGGIDVLPSRRDRGDARPLLETMFPSGARDHVPFLTARSRTSRYSSNGSFMRRPMRDPGQNGFKRGEVQGATSKLPLTALGEIAGLRPPALLMRNGDYPSQAAM